MRVIHVQPALPRYRINFFDRLSMDIGCEMQVFYSRGSLGVLTEEVNSNWAKEVPSIRSLILGFAWQPKVIGISIRSKDIIVLSGNPRHLSSLILLIKAKLIGAKVVWWGHYWSSTSRRWRQLLRFIPMLISDAILFYTDDEVAAFCSETKTISCKRLVSALNNGLDNSQILNLRLAYTPYARERAVFFIGRITEKAELSLLLQALVVLGNLSPRVHIVGDGPLKDLIQMQASELNVSHYLVWYPPTTNEAEISQIANRCRLFVYPGQVGLSLIHSMAYGLPSVVHDRRSMHMPEIAAFKQGFTGYSFRYSNAVSLADTIRKGLENEAELIKMSVNSINVVDSTYTTKGMAERFLSLIRNMQVVK